MPLNRLLLLLEIPAVAVVFHGLAYLLHLPGFEVTVNSYGGKQPIAFEFFKFGATGGLLIPFVLGCWLSMQLKGASKEARRKFAIYLVLSYLCASVAWWFLIGLSVMTRINW